MTEKENLAELSDLSSDAQDLSAVGGLEQDSDIDQMQLSQICEALVFASEKPLSLDKLQEVLGETVSLSKRQLREVLALVSERYTDSAVELVEVGSGYRFQTREKYSTWVAKLWDEKPQKYSRALLETLALIAYRQPITRGDIEEIRGVAVSSNIIRTLLEREWVRVIGHREVPGRPAIYGTTKQFLDYFNLNALDQLPALADVRDLDAIGREISQQLELTEGLEDETGSQGSVHVSDSDSGQPLIEGLELNSGNTEVQDESNLLMGSDRIH